MVLDTLSLQSEFENIVVRVATAQDIHFATLITDEMEASAKARGTGIAKRTPEYVAQKMSEGRAVVAHLKDGTWVGFCYIEAWGHGQFVANSGLIVAPLFRKSGVATQIKGRIFNLSREMYPSAKIFGLTTGLAVMRMNSELGYVPVTYSELTNDDEFWSNCRSCVNYDILQSKERKNCLCTGMLYDPARVPVKEIASVNKSSSADKSSSVNKSSSAKNLDLAPNLSAKSSPSKNLFSRFFRR